MTDDDSSLFADDEYWERMRQELDETEYDTELGIEMARDAQRLVAGELTEAAFHDRYHDAVVEEFGEDERGLDLDELAAEADVDVDEDASLADRLQALAEDGELGRREVMKKGGAAALALGVGLSGTGQASSGDSAAQAGGDTHEGNGKQYGMVINLNNCDGCLSCVVACKETHGTSTGAHWLYVMAYDDHDQDQENFLVRPCMHCDEAPCEKVCPVGARHTREDGGLVLSDYEICIGCRYCMVSCPYGANYFQWGEPDRSLDEFEDTFTHDKRDRWVDGPPPTGVMGKCSFEPAWQDGQMGEELVGRTACEIACQMDAIHFGDMNDPESAPNQHLREYREAHPNDQSEFPNRPENTVSTFRLLEDLGTDPNVVYVGNEPSPHAEQVEGPVAYEDVGLVDNRKESVLEKGAAANQEGGEQA